MNPTDAPQLGLFAVFYDGETRPVAGFVLEQDAERYAKEHDGGGEASYRIEHVHVARATPSPSPALPSSASPEEYYEAQASADHEARVAEMDKARLIAERFVCNVNPANPLQHVLLRDLNSEEVAAIASIIEAELGGQP